LLLKIFDASQENAIEQSETVKEVLIDLEGSNKPRVRALNKIDPLDDPRMLISASIPMLCPYLL